MLKSCSRCGRVHERGPCPINPPKYKRNYERSDIRRFRSSPAWRSLAERVRARDDNLCQACLHSQPMRLTTQGLSVHHVVPIAESWDARLDEDNAITLCAEHHRLAEQGMIGRDQLFEWIEQSKRRAHRPGRGYLA